MTPAEARPVLTVQSVLKRRDLWSLLKMPRAFSVFHALSMSHNLFGKDRGCRPYILCFRDEICNTATFGVRSQPTAAGHDRRNPPNRVVATLAKWMQHRAAT